MAKAVRNDGYVQGLYDAFRRRCPEAFAFLVADFGYELVGIREVALFSISATYQSLTTAVEIRLEPRESGIFVYLIRLIDGRIPAYLKYPSHWLMLDCLLLLRSASAPLETQRSSKPLTPGNVTFQLDTYATKLRMYAADILRGDFSSFPEAQKLCHDRTEASASLGPAISIRDNL